MSGSFYVEESGMGESSQRPNLVDGDAEGDFREETQEGIARVKEEINVLKREKAIALLRGFPKKCVSEIEKSDDLEKSGRFQTFGPRDTSWGACRSHLCFSRVLGSDS